MKKLGEIVQRFTVHKKGGGKKIAAIRVGTNVFRPAKKIQGGEYNVLRN